jgi:type I restriction enzyme S subunit
MMAPAGYLFTRQKRSGYEEEQLLSVYREFGVIPKDSRDDNFNKASEDLSTYQLVEPSDLVINKMKAWQGSLGVSEFRGIVSPAYFVASPVKEFNRRFVHYLLRCSDYLVEYQTRSAGIRVNQWDLDWDDFRRIPIALPPEEEQERIANFLDEQTARIDALIAEKEQLLERISEYRQSLVSSAVTEGVPGRHAEFTLHSSLGRVPSSWRVGRFRHYVQVKSGQVDPENSAYSNMVLIAPNHIESGTGRLLSTELAVEQAAESGKYWCDAGDVIYSKIRPALRKATIAPFDCLCSADMYPLKGIGALSNGFLFWYLLSVPFSDFAVQESMRVAMPKLNRETLADAAIPLPPPEEQSEIVEYIRCSTESVDSLAEHVSQHMARLREYRSSLISAAVTGQLNLDLFGLEPA